MSTLHTGLYEYEIEKPDCLPDTGTPGRHFPLIVYLHGIGESGGDRSSQVRKHGPWKDGQLNLNIRDRLGQYFVVAPHLENRRQHWDVRRLAATLRAAFGEIQREHGDDIIDCSRVYVTGNSRGGRGALELALEGFPDPKNDSLQSTRRPFKAAAIICPERGATGGASARLEDQTRYQFFHRENDVNPKTRGTYFNFRNAPQTNFHIYAGCNHDCWTATYANPALYQWFDDPDSQLHWGTACDYGMCAQDANDFIEVKKPIQAPFCSHHAQQYEHMQWGMDYKTRLQNVP